MKLVRQPRDSNQCGQCCVAMVLGISRIQSIKLFGHSEATYSMESVRVLNANGIKTAPRRKRINKKKPLPEFCIVRMGFIDNAYCHVAVYKDGKFYDPSRGIITKYPKHVCFLSYLEIFE